MHFDIAHDFDIPLDALELALISPTFYESVAKCLPRAGKIEQVSHAFDDGKLRRVWRFELHVDLPAFAEPYFPKSLFSWDETTVYDLKRHASTWSIDPDIRAEWKKFFSASGDYAMEPGEAGGTKRFVRGDLTLDVPVVKPIAERIIVGEVRKALDAEASALRDIATLA